MLVAATAVVVLTVGSLIAIAFVRSSSSSCSASSLSGTVVDATLVDMSMMGGARSGWRHWHMGMMRVVLSPSRVSAGTVSLQVTNAGFLDHELVVLPLSSGATVGSRSVGSDGTVSENGAVGEASATCSGGSGSGIDPGAVGWVTLRLPAGRYELLCNLPGHYTAGMFAELDVG